MTTVYPQAWERTLLPLAYEAEHQGVAPNEGNVRRIIIRHEGQTVMELPLTVGVVSALAMPQLVAISAMSALLAQSSIEVVRIEESRPAV